MYDCLYDFSLFTVYQLFNLFERKMVFNVKIMKKKSAKKLFL